MLLNLRKKRDNTKYINMTPVSIKQYLIIENTHTSLLYFYSMTE